MDGFAHTSRRPAAASRSGARERLLDATSALLAERDTLDISLAEISARAALNHGLVNYYFGGKERLLIALLERDAGQALNALGSLVEKNLPPLKKIELHIHGVIDTYYRFPYINRLINMLQSSSEDNARELSRIFIVPLKNYQAQLLAEARDLLEIDPQMFYFSVIGCCDFLFHSRNTLPFAFGLSQIDESLKTAYANHVVNMILNGIRRGVGETTPERHRASRGQPGETDAKPRRKIRSSTA